MGSPVRGSDRVVRFSTKTDSLAEVEMDGDVVGSLEAEARSISAAEQGTTNSASSFNARHDRTTTAARQTGRNPMGGFYSLRQEKPAPSPPRLRPSSRKGSEFVFGEPKRFSLFGWIQGAAVIQQALQARADGDYHGIGQHAPADAQLLERNREGLAGLAG